MDPQSLWMKVAEQSAFVYAHMQKTIWFMHLSKVLLAEYAKLFQVILELCGIEVWI